MFSYSKVFILRRFLCFDLSLCSFYIKMGSCVFIRLQENHGLKKRNLSIDIFEKINPGFNCIMPFSDGRTVEGSCCNEMLSLPCTCSQKAFPSILVHPSLWNSNPLQWIQKLGGELSESVSILFFSLYLFTEQEVKYDLYYENLSDFFCRIRGTDTKYLSLELFFCSFT